jgi:RHS repeat-associated protein
VPAWQYDCANVVERTVWDGDQILWEVRVADRDFQENDAPQGPRAGRVGYTHGPGIDAPLSFVRADLDADPPHAVLVHLSWRGMPDGGTFPDGSTLRGSLDLARYEWPTRHYTAYFREPYPKAEQLWLGSIVTGQRDASGLLYRRNRYFDPQANQFTQEDPIGIAGGLNTYGFAGGDPVSYSDPYGLAASDCLSDPLGCIRAHQQRINARNTAMLEAAGMTREEQAEIMDLGLQMGAMSAGVSRGRVTDVGRRLIGRGHPVKTGAGGRPQPYDRATGQYLSPSANPGLRRSPLTQFTQGVVEGFVDEAGGGPPPTEVPANLARGIGQMVGRVGARIKDLF